MRESEKGSGMREHKRRVALVALPLVLAVSLGMAGGAAAKNFHLVDALPNGFRFYRSGVPTKKDLERFSDLGIQEIAVLSGDAESYEIKYAHLVPNLKIVYNEKQDSGEPLTATFLEWFDNWIQEARAEGKVIAIRCRCGCHRTGRLAAYYQMKYQNLTSKEAYDILDEYGKRMFLHRDLESQVKALEDYIRGRPCSQEPKRCVEDDRAH